MKSGRSRSGRAMNSATKLKAWAQKNPCEWIEKYLGMRLWSAQRELIEAVRDNSEVSFASGNGLGKSSALAALVTWFGSCHDDSMIVTTASKFEQVRSILWREIAKCVRNATTDLE